MQDGTTKYNMGKTTCNVERDIMSHIAANYGYLLNVPARRNVPHTWLQLANLMVLYYDNDHVEWFALMLRKIHNKHFA